MNKKKLKNLNIIKLYNERQKKKKRQKKYIIKVKKLLGIK